MSKYSIPTEEGYYWCSPNGVNNRVIVRVALINFGLKKELAVCKAGSSTIWELDYFENWSAKIEERENV